jgi:hypothetical protein
MNPYDLDSDHTPVLNADRMMNVAISPLWQGVAPRARAHCYRDGGMHRGRWPGTPRRVP